ncbi:hypothetical protein F2Q69_00016812 [Brassica cretica]|uniref:Uncharacterized protein n=1 Tax=Brassica cretica TaxID=69181 RepID=A0A8S9QRB7_BRACR|nr:hypothetical protein F2Q69_00016812 [Brassica cretica]
MASNLFLLRSVSPNKWNRKVSFFVSFSSSFQSEEQECVDMGKNIAPDAELHFYIVKDRFVRITLYTERSILLMACTRVNGINKQGNITMLDKNGGGKHVVDLLQKKIKNGTILMRSIFASRLCIHFDVG